jgi:hypothetical protein
MRSKLVTLVCVLALGGGLRCDRRGDRVVDICEALESCTGFWTEHVVDGYPLCKNGQSLSSWDSCKRQLSDAIVDRRLTRAGLTSCASCLGSHEILSSRQDDCSSPPCENCESVLSDRDCDASCKEVWFALRSRTSQAMRVLLCNIIDESCGMEGATSCRDGLCDLYKNFSGIGDPGAEGLGGAAGTAQPASTSCAAPPSAEQGEGKPLSLDEALELDATVEKCFACAQSVRKSFAGSRPEDRPQRCDALVDNCLAACALVRPANAVLAPAAAALALCELSARCSELPPLIECSNECEAPPVSEGGNGGAGGEAGAAGAPVEKAVSDFATCFRDRLQCRDEVFLSAATLCIDCARDDECSVVGSQCAPLCYGGGS